MERDEVRLVLGDLRAAGAKNTAALLEAHDLAMREELAALRQQLDAVRSATIYAAARAAVDARRNK